MHAALAMEPQLHYIGLIIIHCWMEDVVYYTLVDSVSSSAHVVTTTSAMIKHVYSLYRP